MNRSAFLTRTGLALVCLILAAAPFAWAAKTKTVKSGKSAGANAAYPFVTSGVKVGIKSAAIAKDGTITARVTITDSKGGGLDVNNVQTPGTLTVRLVAAYIPSGKTQYVAYTTSVLNAGMNKNPSQTVAGTDSGGKFALVDSLTGTYDYTFGTKAPASFDGSVTHTIGMQAERDLSDFGFDNVASDDAVYSWVPNGGAVTTIRDVVNEAQCNSCHDPISAHGGARKKMAYCVLCHTTQSTNPDTLNTVDFPQFIHKLHMGSSLPSVKAGTPYQIFHRSALQDYSTIVFPADARNCTSCHSSKPKQGNNYLTNPSRAACGSCHDDVNFATGDKHVNLPQVTDNQCKNCHSDTATADFDASIPGAHVVANRSTNMPGIVATIQKIDNATPGSAPVVTFKVVDKAGNPVDITKLTTFRVVIAGPNTDYQTGPGGVRVSETPPATIQGANGVYTYTMTTKIPAAATGSYTISLEGRNNYTLAAGTTKQTATSDNMKPVRTYFSVDGSKVVARRQVVASEKCMACHVDMTFVHGGTRGDTQECVMCHNPTLADGTSKVSVNFAALVHNIHRGENLEFPYVIGTTNYQEVRFPGDLRDCNQCHVNNSYQIENVGAKALVATPGRFTPTTPPISAACQGCHDGQAAASHMLANTTAIGEDCQSCHGASSEFAVDKVHSRTR